ncbi:MAG: hypothetical protein UHN88_06155 [Eubacterium sp.]|nr:hypothetical protein [Eubacterium sp.]
MANEELHLTEDIKKLLLAGIGAVATGAEKSKAILDELVDKGELTVEQGKVLNQELKHKVQAAADHAKEKVQEVREEVKEKVGEQKAEDADFSKFVATLSDEQKAALKKALEGEKAPEEAPADEKAPE